MKFKENVQNCNENVRKCETKHCGEKGTVEEGNFERVSNFEQKKGFLC